MVLLTKMPLAATGALTLSSPVLGLYRYSALDVYSVEMLPLVTPANVGYRSEAVDVSLLTTAPPSSAQVEVEEL